MSQILDEVREKRAALGFPARAALISATTQAPIGAGVGVGLSVLVRSEWHKGRLQDKLKATKSNNRKNPSLLGKLKEIRLKAGLDAVKVHREHPTASKVFMGAVQGAASGVGGAIGGYFGARQALHVI